MFFSKLCVYFAENLENTMAKKITKNKIKEAVKEKPKPSGKPQSKTATPKAAAPKNIIVSYNKIDNDLKMELFKKYPEGYANYVHRYPKPNGEFFFAVPLDVEDMHYLIKVEVKVDNLITEDEFDKHFGDISEVDSKAIGEVEVDDDDNDDDADEQAADDGDDDDGDDE